MKIFIDNLSLLVTEEDLHLIFKPFGEIGEIKITYDKQSKLPIAFVEMKSDRGGREAINALDGIELIDHKIILRVRENDSGRRGAGDRRDEKSRRILSIRRITRFRRMEVLTVNIEDKRSKADRRTDILRRQNSTRRNAENRRVSIDRRVLA